MAKRACVHGNPAITENPARGNCMRLHISYKFLHSSYKVLLMRLIRFGRINLNSISASELIKFSASFQLLLCNNLYQHIYTKITKR